MIDWMLGAGSFVAGVILLIVGGDTMVRGAVGLAARLGVPAFIVGLTVLAFGTSAPELALNVAAAIKDNSELSFGNVIGSNIANIGLIMGISALVRPLKVHASIIQRELPLMVGATFAVVAFCYAPPHISGRIQGIGRIEGAVLLMGFVLFCLMLYRSTGEEQSLGAEIPGETRTLMEAGGAKSIRVSVTLVLAGLGSLMLGGYLAEHGAVDIAQRLHISNEIIGVTIVAVATSLPELSASLAAARRGHSDLAVGNIVGSNLFNLLLVLGVTVVVSPVPLPAEGLIPLIAVTILSIALVPITMTKDRTVSRIEGGALLAAYIAFLGLQVALRMAN